MRHCFTHVEPVYSRQQYFRQGATMRIPSSDMLVFDLRVVKLSVQSLSPFLNPEDKAASCAKDFEAVQSMCD